MRGGSGRPRPPASGREPPRAPLGPPALCLHGGISGPEQSRLQQLGEQPPPPQPERQSGRGQKLGRGAFPRQPEALPAPKPRFLRGHSASAPPSRSASRRARESAAGEGSGGGARWRGEPPPRSPLGVAPSRGRDGSCRHAQPVGKRVAPAVAEDAALRAPWCWRNTSARGPGWLCGRRPGRRGVCALVGHGGPSAVAAAMGRTVSSEARCVWETPRCPAHPPSCGL